MEVKTFTARSAPLAVAQIRERLGPEAVVLNIRRVRAKGISGLLQKTNVEVLACVPEPAKPNTGTDVFIEELRSELAAIKQSVLSLAQREVAAPQFENRAPTFPRSEPIDVDAGGWRVGSILEDSGLLRLHTHQVMERLWNSYGQTPPSSLSEELQLAQRILSESWKPAPSKRSNTHIFVGTPGSGKTIALCKWMTNAVLLENRAARVWRLDGLSANTSEALSVHCEILGVPIYRCPASLDRPPSELLFVDLPGVNAADSAGLAHLQQMLSEMGDAEVHLVLNGAYESAVQLAQIRAFSGLPIHDLIVTHLDEETRWGKLWNLVLGTNYSLRALSAGQNIPGDFRTASAAEILGAQFARK